MVLARLPLCITEASYHDYAVTLRWQGGSGRYQLQGRNSLSAGEWQSIGTTTNTTTVTHSCLGSRMSFRVQSLSNP